MLVMRGLRGLVKHHSYHKQANPTFLQVLNINPNMEFLGTLQKSRFW